MMKGITRLDRENISDNKLHEDVMKKEQYKKELEMQMVEKKRREAEEKQKKKQIDMIEEERVAKEREEQQKRFEKEKTEKQAKIKAAEEVKNQVANHTMQVKKGASKNDTPINTNQNQTGNDDNNLIDIIRTNHDWIDTGLSKEYVMYKRREDAHIAGEPVKQTRPMINPYTNNVVNHIDSFDAFDRPQNNIRNDIVEDKFKLDLLSQLDRAKVMYIHHSERSDGVSREERKGGEDARISEEYILQDGRRR